MKKTLEIEMEAECLICPHLELETITLEPNFKIHQCKNIDFCRVVHKAWEAAKDA